MTKPDFEVLVERHSGELYGYLWRLTGNEPDASDCLQDTYLRAFKAFQRLSDYSQLRAWLYKIATNSARSLYTRNHRRQTEPLDEPMASKEKAVDVLVLERTQLAEVKEAVMKLPDRQRAALMMRKYQELDYAEIAVALDCSEDSARANVYQALKKLREQFAEVEE